MSRALWFLAGLILGVCALWLALDSRHDAARAAWEADTLRLAEALAINAAEEARADAERERLRAVLDSLEQMVEPLPRPRPPLPQPEPPDGDLSVLVTFWKDDAMRARARVDSLTADLEVVSRETVRRDRIIATQAARIRLDSLSLVRVTAERDSAWRVIRSVPEAPRCRILFLPCPTVTAGYGAVLSDGAIRHGPGVTAGWAIRF